MKIAVFCTRHGAASSDTFACPLLTTRERVGRFERVGGAGRELVRRAGCRRQDGEGKRGGLKRGYNIIEDWGWGESRTRTYRIWVNLKSDIRG